MVDHYRALLKVASGIRDSVIKSGGALKGRLPLGASHGGDTQFGVDEIAEETAQHLAAELFADVAVYTEDGADADLGPDKLLLIDPIDGTRAAAAGLEMGTVSIALCDNHAEASLADVQEALVMEIKSGAWLYAQRDREGLLYKGFGFKVPRINHHANLERMFWSFEFNGHPARLMTAAYGHLIDKTANKGGCFIFNSATFSIVKIVTGQLDAYVDIGNRLLRDTPALEPEFRGVGLGSVLHLFPYDIAAINLIAEKAGVVITDAYGRKLANTRLRDTDWRNQQSCIAAATPELHENLLKTIRFDATC
jgi:myo-inositol-1(or 4)-monophosphatase